MQTLLRDLRSGNSATHEKAAQSLYHLGEECRPIYFELLQELLLEPNCSRWIYAVIEKIGPQVTDLPQLQKCLQHSNEKVRFSAARALVKLGEESAPLTSDLIERLLDTNSQVVDSVMWALGGIGPVAIEQLTQTAKTASLPLRKMSILALARYTSHLPQRVPTILTSLESSDLEIRNAAALAVCLLTHRLWHDRNGDSEPSVELTQLVTALNAIVADDSFSVDREWLHRIHGYYNPPA